MRQYYSLFDRENQRFGLAKRGDCTPGTEDADSSVENHCRARARSHGTCGGCVGPVDDLQFHRGYCEWCPQTQTCVAADPKSLVSPCPQAMGFAIAHLDNAEGGACPELTAVENRCQEDYQYITDLVMRGGVRGSCSEDAQDNIDDFATRCASAQTHAHQRGHSNGSGCWLCVVDHEKLAARSRHGWLSRAGRRRATQGWQLCVGNRVVRLRQGWRVRRIAKL